MNIQLFLEKGPGVKVPRMSKFGGRQVCKSGPVPGKPRFSGSMVVTGTASHR